MSVASIRDQLASQAGNRSNTAGAKPERKTSDLWLNIGITIPGAGEDGGDLFVSLPTGIPLDDMKDQAVRGTNKQWIQLAQTKNALLAILRKQGTELEPGERVAVPEFSVELARRAEPDATGDAKTNPMVAALLAHLGGDNG